MRIGFDTSQTGRAKAGCGYFAEGLIRQLAADDDRNGYILYPAVGDLFWDADCATSTFASDRPMNIYLAAEDAAVISPWTRVGGWTAP